LLGALACSGGDKATTPNPPPPTIQSVVVTPSTATLTAVGETTTLAAQVRMPNARFFVGIELRTPVAVRQAQAVMFVEYLNHQYPAILPAILARIRATPGTAFTNAMLLQEITTRTGLTIAQLDALYLAYARTLRP